MRKGSTKCTLYSAYVTPDDPRGAPDPAGTRRGPLGRTISHDRYSHAPRTAPGAPGGRVKPYRTVDRAVHREPTHHAKWKPGKNELT